MAVCETKLDSSGFYHTALDTLMESLSISTTPNLEPSRCNSFRKNVSASEEDKYFSFCSTIKSVHKSDNFIKESRLNTTQTSQSSDIATNTRTNLKDTPKRLVATTRKQKLFSSSETEEFMPKSRCSANKKELSPQALLLKKAITRLECMQRRQERMALSKKPLRTSLRV